MIGPSWILAVLVICSCKAVAPLGHETQGATKMVVLRIEQVGGAMPKATSLDVKLRFIIQNNSQDRIVVNKRGILAGRKSPDFLRDVWMAIRNEHTGRTSEFDCLIDTRPPNSADYRTLGPGENVEFERTLECFPMERGRYLVIANIDVGPPPAVVPAGAKPLPLPLVSNQISIEILGER